MSEWQPIATAPRDGTLIIVCWLGRVQTAIWRDDVEYPTWQEDNDGDFAVMSDEVSHWMPLPSPPNSNDKKAAAAI